MPTRSHGEIPGPGPRPLPSPAEGARHEAARRPGLLAAAGDPALDRVIRVAAAALAVPTVLFSVADGERELVLSAVMQGRPGPLRELPLAHSLGAGALLTGGLVRIPDVGEDPRFDRSPVVEALGVVAFLAVPVRLDGRVVGALSVIAPHRRPWVPEDVVLLEDVAVLLASELGALLARRPVGPPPPRVAPPAVPGGSAPATRATPLLDRRGFAAAAAGRMGQARPEGRALLLTLVRIEDLAVLRDRFGPVAADAAVAEVLGVMTRSAGPGDLLGRVTSDCFVLLGPDAGQGEAARVLGRLQLGVAEVNGEGAHPWAITVRCGVSGWDPAHPISLDQLLLRADTSARERARAQISA